MAHKINLDDDFDPKTVVYTPSQVATYGLNSVRLAKETYESGAGITLPIEEIREYMPPVEPGKLAAIIAQTSNYKSGLMHFMERMSATELAEKDDKKHILIHVSVEESVEDQAYLELARESGEYAGDLSRGIVQDWNKLEESAIRIGEVPIYRIGDSLARSENMPLLYISNMVRAINDLVGGKVLDWQPKVAGIFFDYLQAFPIDPVFRAESRDSQRRMQVRDDIYKLRMLANKYMCPVFVAVQAKQHLEGAHPPIMLPGQYDGEESSSIAQRCDRIVTLWMPKSTHAIGDEIRTKSLTFAVEDNQLMIKIVKQRGMLPSGKQWMCRVNFQTNTIALETSDDRRAKNYVDIPEHWYDRHD
jgi:hypothetical protein